MGITHKTAASQVTYFPLSLKLGFRFLSRAACGCVPIKASRSANGLGSRVDFQVRKVFVGVLSVEEISGEGKSEGSGT
jgi:hypothetical protein